MQVIDGRSKVRLAFPVGKDKPAHPGPFPLPEHCSGPVCKRDNPAGILALAFPDPKKAKPSAIDRR
jgi:hypothetical protein